MAERKPGERAIEELARLRGVFERIEAKLPDPEAPVERYRDPHDHDSIYDVRGRKEPRRIDLGLAFRAFPHLAARCRVVPARAVAKTGEDDEGPFALLVCTCGQKPVVRSSLEKCGGCERWYLIEGGAVLVLYGDMTPPTRTQAS